MTTTTSPARVFISHAVADKKLVDALVDLLQVGCDLSVQQIFASSIEGVRIPQGRPFVEHIKTQLTGAALVIEVVTPSYWASPFCLCELGGQWALELDAFPLIVPPQSFADLKAVLHINQAAVINRPEDLDDLRDRIKESLGTNVPTARWNAKRDMFLNNQLPKLLETLAGPQHVPVGRIAEIEEQLRELETMLTEKTDALESLQGRYETLAAASTREEALDAVRPDDEFEQMDLLQSAVLGEFRELPFVVREAIFEEVTKSGSGWMPAGDDQRAADEQEREGLLRWHWTGDGFVPNEEEPVVSRAVDAARKFYSWEPSGEFEEAFKREHDVAWAPNKRRLWVELNLL